MQQVDSTPDVLLMEGEFPEFLPQELFDHWTTPSLLTQWWPTQAEVLPCPGGRYKFSWPEMDWVLQGTYEVFEAAQRLGFTWKWNHEPVDIAPLHVLIEISGTDEGSHLKLKQWAYSDSPAAQQDRQGHLEGWIHFCMKLKGLRAVAE